MGAVTPIGNSVDEFWKAVKKEKIGFGEITQFDASEYKCHLAAEVKNFDAKNYIDAKAAKRMELFCQIRSGRMLFRTTGCRAPAGLFGRWCICSLLLEYYKVRLL